MGRFSLPKALPVPACSIPPDVYKRQPYDRLGLEEEYMDILGIKVPSLTIPVTPGRNLAVIVEVAAMNSRQKKMGYNAAEELLNQLGMSGDLAEEVL